MAVKQLPQYKKGLVLKSTLINFKMKKQAVLILFITCIMSVIANGQTSKPADYLKIPGPIVFDKQSYSLSWTSHPANNFYKQEYIVKGDDPDHFQTMILTDVITGEPDIKKVVSSKLAELKQMKASNPVVNYEVISNAKTGEYMLDYLLSANNADGSMSVVERNVYRYKTFTDKAGRQGVQLFGVSTRSYGAAIDKFFTALKVNRKDLVNKVSLFQMPEIKI
jgi:hypothetical protein